MKITYAQENAERCLDTYVRYILQCFDFKSDTFCIYNDLYYLYLDSLWISITLLYYLWEESSQGGYTYKSSVTEVLIYIYIPARPYIQTKEVYPYTFRLDHTYRQTKEVYPYTFRLDHTYRPRRFTHIRSGYTIHTDQGGLPIYIPARPYIQTKEVYPYALRLDHTYRPRRFIPIPSGQTILIDQGGSSLYLAAIPYIIDQYSALH